MQTFLFFCSANESSIQQSGPACWKSDTWKSKSTSSTVVGTVQSFCLHVRNWALLLFVGRRTYKNKSFCLQMNTQSKNVAVVPWWYNLTSARWYSSALHQRLVESHVGLLRHGAVSCDPSVSIFNLLNQSYEQYNTGKYFSFSGNRVKGSLNKSLYWCRKTAASRSALLFRLFLSISVRNRSSMWRAPLQNAPVVCTK